MKPLKTAVLITTCILIVLTSFLATAYAITGNYRPESTPYACIVLLFSDSARTQLIGYSSGVLISPTVVITSGHSVAGGVAAIVCFDQNPITSSIDETGKISYQIKQPIYNGVPMPYPNYIVTVEAGAKNNNVLQTSDVGLIILDTPVQECLAKLPTANLADTLTTKSNLQVIGYGVQYQNTPRGHGANTWMGSFSRYSATVQLLSTNFQGSDKYLKCTANAAQGKGGVAYGDSGGPVVCSVNGQSFVLAVNAYVNNVNCAGVTYHTRIDNPQVLNWINTYI